MPASDAPPVNQSVRASFHAIVAYLCGAFVGLSPFEVMNTEIGDVYDLYVDALIYQHRKENKADGVWVTSRTASWH